MKKAILSFLLLMTCVIHTAQAQRYFNRLYGKAAHLSFGLLELSDGYIIAGDVFANNWVEAKLIRVNLKGDTLWSKLLYQVPYFSASGKMIKDTDGNLVITSIIGDTINNNNKDIYLAKVNINNGSIIWSKRYGGSLNDFSTSVIKTKDGGFLIGGTTQNYGAGGEDLYVIKTDKSGNFKWQKTYGGTGNEGSYSFTATKDNGYIFGGFTTSFGRGGIDMYVVKLDSLCNQQWQYTMGTTDDDMQAFVTPLKDGNFLMVGGLYTAFNAYKSHLTKLNPNGNVIWQNNISLGSYSHFYGTPIENDDYTIVVSIANKSSKNFPISTIIKLNSRGDSIWTKPYYTRNDADNYCYTMIPTRDGGFLAGGSAFDFVSNLSQAWVVKMDCQAADSLNYPPNDSICRPLVLSVHPSKPVLEGISIYPNPFSNEATVTYSSRPGEKITLQVYDIQGSLVKSYLLNSELNTFSVSANDFRSGIYFYSVEVLGIVSDRKKMIVIK